MTRSHTRKEIASHKKTKFHENFAAGGLSRLLLMADDDDELESGKPPRQRHTKSSLGSNTRHMTNKLHVLYVAVFLDLFAVSLVVPLFSIIYQKLALDPVTYG